MTEQLKHAIEAMQRLPAEAQNVIAARILEEIEEQEWDAIVSQPRVQKRLRELAKQALEEDLDSSGSQSLLNVGVSGE